jgi:hypothetical protein
MGSLTHVQAEIEADVADRSIVKDAFVRVRDEAKQYRLWAGQFKAPYMERELVSAWDLPLIRRGVV